VHAELNVWTNAAGIPRREALPSRSITGSTYQPAPGIVLRPFLPWDHGIQFVEYGLNQLKTVHKRTFLSNVISTRTRPQPGARNQGNPLSEFRNEVRFSRTERQLGQKPEGVKKCGIARSVFQTEFGSFESRSGDVSGIGTGPNEADHLLPLLRSRKSSEPSMTHAPSTVSLHKRREVSTLRRWMHCRAAAGLGARQTAAMKWARGSRTESIRKTLQR
jgi:hypothetical protein